MGDEDLELWKQRKMLEMHRRMLSRIAEEERRKAGKDKGEVAEDPGKVLGGILAGRAWEVLQAARRQFPDIMPSIEKALIQLAVDGRVKGPISGEQLLWFFRRLGMNVRLETHIRILESGELKTIAEKLRERE